jgi:undecaprenyl-diphosphatase
MTMPSAIPTSDAATEPDSTHAAAAAEIGRRHFSLDLAGASGFPNPPFTPVHNHSPRVAIWVGKFLEADLQAVRIASRLAESSMARFCAVSITKLGNGWLYPILAALIFVRWGFSGCRMIVLAGLNAALVHSVYPVIKRRFHRKRPYEVDQGIPCLLSTMDKHSFPSGHAMTLTSVFVPIVILWPAMTMSAIVMTCCLAWSRMATAHHFPSDVFAGVLLGAGVSYPISACIIFFW